MWSVTSIAAHPAFRYTYVLYVFNIAVRIFIFYIIEHGRIKVEVVDLFNTRPKCN